jgi:hypothetical protein
MSMTFDEAKYYLIENKPIIGFKKHNEALGVAIIALGEVQAYREIGTVEQLQFMKSVCDMSDDMLKTLADSIRARMKYEAIGTVEEFKALKEKNEPKKVQYDEYGKEEGYPYCECGKCLIDDFVGVSYCPDCGQKLDWQ